MRWNLAHLFGMMTTNTINGAIVVRQTCKCNEWKRRCIQQTPTQNSQNVKKGSPQYPRHCDTMWNGWNEM